MFTPDPGSWFLPIPDPGSKNSKKGEGWKNFFVKPYFVATNFTKMKIILFLKCWRKNLGQFSKNYRTFYSKNVNKVSEIWVWDPGSGIRDPGSGKNLLRVPDAGVKKAPDPRCRIRIRNTAFKGKTEGSKSYRTLLRRYKFLCVKSGIGIRSVKKDEQYLT